MPRTRQHLQRGLPPGSSNVLTLPYRPPPDTVFPFSRLPIEIRLMIWRRTFPRGNGFGGRRRIRLAALRYGSNDPMNRVFTSASTPVALHVNRESRREALRHYRLLFNLGAGQDVPRHTPIYYNPSLDIIELRGRHLHRNNIARPMARGFAWLARHAQADFDAIQTLEIRGWYRPTIGDDTWSHLRDNADPFAPVVYERPRSLRHFRRLTFLNIIDEFPRTFHESTIHGRERWPNPDCANTDGVREYIRRRQYEDPSYMMPSIRYAPSDHLPPYEIWVEYVLQQWPRNRRRGPGGSDPFTDVTSSVPANEDVESSVASNEDVEMEVE
jgi:hypothetical protein